MAKRILLVEDDELLSELLEMVLSVEGYDVACTANGLDAIERLQTATFDLIILDLMMPLLDGMRFLQRVPRDTRPPVIVLSASINAMLVEKAEQEGAAAVLRKPVDPATFQKAVRDELAGERKPKP